MRVLGLLGLAAGMSPAALPAAAGPCLPAIFGDHMVVQAEAPVRVWGRDRPGAAVRVALAGESARVLADGAGRWGVELPALKPGGPYTLTVDGSARRAFSDVLVGEVWLGSGQSNLELPLRATRDADRAVAGAADPGLRLFTVDRAAAFKPLDDVSGSWRVCSPESAADFSAVAYYFGRDLRKALGRPVGLVAASWGGTPAEDWVPRPALETREPYRGVAERWAADPRARALWTRGAAFELRLKNVRLAPAKGRPLALPLDGWDHEEKPGSTGTLASRAGVLAFRGLVRGGAWATAGRALSAPGTGAPWDLRPYQRLVFSVRGTGSWTVGLGQPDILDSDSYASAPFAAGPRWAEISVPLDTLKQGGWGRPEAFTPWAVNRLAFNAQVPFWPDLPGVAYNGMIAPLTRFPVRGVLWYQGESNVGRAAEYRGLLDLLARSWRRAWGRDDLCFLVVQLPRFGGAGTGPGAGWARLRRAQADAVDGLPHAGLAVALDLGETGNIHPKNKAPVGRRLALLAESLVYGMPVEAYGPRPKSVAAASGGLALSFDHGRGLALRAPASGFELAGRDGTFHPARARLRGATLLLDSPAVPDPRAARYAFSDDPDAVLFNAAGLPAAPFDAALGAGDRP